MLQLLCLQYNSINHRSVATLVPIEEQHQHYLRCNSSFISMAAPKGISVQQPSISLPRAVAAMQSHKHLAAGSCLQTFYQRTKRHGIWNWRTYRKARWDMNNAIQAFAQRCCTYPIYVLVLQDVQSAASIAILIRAPPLLQPKDHTAVEMLPRTCKKGMAWSRKSTICFMGELMAWKVVPYVA